MEQKFRSIVISLTKGVFNMVATKQKNVEIILGQEIVDLKSLDLSNVHEVLAYAKTIIDWDSLTGFKAEGEQFIRGELSKINYGTCPMFIPMITNKRYGEGFKPKMHLRFCLDLTASLTTADGKGIHKKLVVDRSGHFWCMESTWNWKSKGNGTQEQCELEKVYFKSMFLLELSEKYPELLRKLLQKFQSFLFETADEKHRQERAALRSGQKIASMVSRIYE